MKASIIIILSTLCLAGTTFAQTTMGERAGTAMDAAGDAGKNAGRETKRAAKKGANRVQEATCMKGDMKCEAEKEQNRGSETKDAATNEMKKTNDKTSH